jgi:hypothetical protein
MQNMNREQAQYLFDVTRSNHHYKPSYAVGYVTRMTKRAPTEQELEVVRNVPLFREYFVAQDATLQTRLTDQKLIDANRKALAQFGCTKAQIAQFADREFLSLPKWLRERMKRYFKPKQKEPLKLYPAAGELQFYVSPQRFPLQRDAATGTPIPLTTNKEKRNARV